MNRISKKGTHDCQWKLSKDTSYNFCDRLSASQAPNNNYFNDTVLNESAMENIDAHLQHNQMTWTFPNH